MSASLFPSRKMQGALPGNSANCMFNHFTVVEIVAVGITPFGGVDLTRSHWMKTAGFPLLAPTVIKSTRVGSKEFEFV